jgi:hypothetical protein
VLSIQFRDIEVTCRNTSFATTATTKFKPSYLWKEDKGQGMLAALQYWKRQGNLSS